MVLPRERTDVRVSFAHDLRNAGAHSAWARMACKQQIGGSNPPFPTKCA